MNWKKIIAIIAGIALIGGFVFKLKSNKEKTTEKIYHFDKEQELSVQTISVKLEDISKETSFTGTFEANKETKLSAETQGKINHILVDAGDFVRQGQTLIQLDNSLLKLQLQTVEVQIEGLEADVNRYTILTQSDAIQGVQLEKTILGLKTAKIQKATLQEQINKTSIKAPFGGFVTMKLTEIGAFAAPGVPLLQITDLAVLKFTINISEKDLNQFELGKSYPVLADIYPDENLSGKITMIGSKANMGGSYPVQFTVSNLANSKIKAGMFGQVALKREAIEKGFLIPSSAIMGSAENAKVYVVKNGKAILQDISISQKIQNKTVVKNGLNEGDVIVTKGFINLFDGANVSIN